jgi:hypothetical protein
MTAGHKWRFFRAGGFDQVKLSSGEDLANLASLDQKLWVALACPTRRLDLDARTLALIDADKDGRIRVPELLAAVQFACRNLKQPDDLLKSAEALPLTAINDATPEGRTLLAAAQTVLRNLGLAGGGANGNLGHADVPAVTVAAFADPAKLFANTLFNGDGIIIAEAATDEATRQVIGEVASCMGAEPDRSGKPGVSQPKIDAFFAAAREHDAWFKEGEANPAILFLGHSKTVAAAQAAEAIRAKADDYFARCRVAAFDARAFPLLNGDEERYREILAGELTRAGQEIAEFPLAHVGAGRPLPLSEGVNPAHADALVTVRRDAIDPVLGARAALTDEDWQRLNDRLRPYSDWMAAQRGGAVVSLGIERVRAILASDAEQQLTDLVAQDKALEPEATAIEDLERLVRYHRDLYRLCINFVNFKDFYDGGDPSIFQAGTLYLDGRACKLCLPVEDAARHAAMAGLAGAYLTYLDCVRPATGEKMQIVAAITAGDSDNLMMGRNGIFYDSKGRDWDATIVKLIDNPISLRQAFFHPYKKFVRLLEEQVAKRASAAEADAHQQLGDAATTTANLDRGPAAAPPAKKKIDIGTVAALGVAFGAIGSFATAIIGYATGVFRLGIPAVAGAVLAIMLIISMPSVVLAYIKLRKRNLGPILDANGWAINTRARVNVPFGTTLTALAHLPPGSRRDIRDPYAEKGFPLKTVLATLVVLYVAWGWYQGKLDRHLPAKVRATSVLGSWAPAAAEPTPAAAPP